MALRLSLKAGITFSPASGRRLLPAGQLEGELATGPRPAVDEDPPAVGFGDLLHDVKADAEADEVAGRLGLDAGKALEEPAPMRGDAREAVMKDGALHADTGRRM